MLLCKTYFIEEAFGWQKEVSHRGMTVPTVKSTLIKCPFVYQGLMPSFVFIIFFSGLKM
jgi:hypothetical protein